MLKNSKFPNDTFLFKFLKLISKFARDFPNFLSIRQKIPLWKSRNLSKPPGTLQSRHTDQSCISLDYLTRLSNNWRFPGRMDSQIDEFQNVP